MEDAPNTIKVCACGAEFTSAQSSGKTCFKCKVQSVGFGFRGPCKPTKQDFHDNTIRSVIEEGNRNITDLGGDPKKDYEFVGKRWV